MYESKLLNRFYRALFHTDFYDTESATQNAKTDYLFECEDFSEWFDRLVNRFVDEASAKDFAPDPEHPDEVMEPVTASTIRRALNACPDFIDDMQTEYEDLKELCSDDEDED
jgi:hypothetical protein